jgi:transcriptional repressor NF-X1
MTRRSCPCGKKSQQVRCSLTGEVPTCGAPCYRVKSCGKHRCLLTCHSGPCPPCDSPVEHKCHCGREVKVFTCGQWSRIEREGNSVRELTCSRICNK